MGFLDDVKDTVDDAKDAVEDTAESVGEAAEEATDAAEEAVEDTAKEAAETAKEVTEEAEEQAEEAVEKVEEAADAVEEAAEEFGEEVQETADSAWDAITSTAESVWEAAKAVAQAVVDLVDLVLDGISAIIGYLRSIPIIGRAIGQIINWIEYIVWGLIQGGIELGAWIIGVHPTKTLRLCFIIPERLKGGPLINPADLTQAIEDTRDVLSSEADIDVKVLGRTTTNGQSARSATDVSCGWKSWLEDLFLKGHYFERWSISRCFGSSFSRLIGLASPVIVFVVDNVEGKDGCSNGPTNDYVVVEADDVAPSSGSDILVVAHEVGHACGLPHYDDNSNLMYGESPIGRNLVDFQARLMRSSPYVTFWG